MNENFNNIQSRLGEFVMGKRFACIFYGYPGTGKTETVYQIARKTQRNIMLVHVTQIKDMWVGESEKNIKALFDRYRNYCEREEKTAILLFNEADAILGIRRESAQRAVDKMENSIQNIILQEMETLEGIMIATTNLMQNFDKAFERRFLYKIEFDKPSVEAKKAIWKSILPTLPDQESADLSNKYDFSGGEVENIARKRTVETIINGTQPTLETLHSFCQSEQLHKPKEPIQIGFN